MTDRRSPAPPSPVRGGRTVGPALVGVLAGGLSGLFGVGGGVLIVPGLVSITGLAQRLAHGTSLAAIVPISVSGVAGYALEGAVDWAAAGLIVLGAAAGAVAGTHVLQRIPERWLRLTFAVVLLLTAARMVIATPPGAGRAPIALLAAIGLVVLGAVSGTLAGLLGVGGGIVIVPALVILFAVPDAVAKGTSLAVIIPTALVGTLRNVRNRNTDLRVGAFVGAFGVLSAFLASRVAVGLDPRLSSLLFAVLIVLVAVRMLIRLPAGSRK